MIKSLFGVWQGSDYKGLTPVEVFSKTILVNRTLERIVYSPPTETVQGDSHEIGVDPGEAICFTRQDCNGTFVAVGPEEEVRLWVNYYFFAPHLVPDNMQLTVRNHMLVVGTVPVVCEVLKSYSPEIMVAIEKVLRKRYVDAGAGMMETLLHQRGEDCKEMS